jgi:hypothetical protein
MNEITNHYVRTASRKANKPHNMKAEDIRTLFIRVGWVGKIHERHPLMKLVPFFDRGPGPCE